MVLFGLSGKGILKYDLGVFSWFDIYFDEMNYKPSFVKFLMFFTTFTSY
jgi:hypothetical protein